MRLGVRNFANSAISQGPLAEAKGIGAKFYTYVSSEKTELEHVMPHAGKEYSP